MKAEQTPSARIACRCAKPFAFYSSVMCATCGYWLSDAQKATIRDALLRIPAVKAAGDAHG